MTLLPEIKHIRNNESLEGLVYVTPNIVYSTQTGENIPLTLLLPWGAKENGAKLPLIVFVQGSAWTDPDLNYELAQLAYYARNGYAVATLKHRNCLNGHPFPAFLQDVKTAIRFLRSHAAEYAIDAERIGIWGTSSGGNTALLVGLTGDDPAYKTAEYADKSDAVKMVVECFGPTNLMRMVHSDIPAEGNGTDIFASLTHGLDVREVLRAMSPVSYVKPGCKCPPTLLIHGNADDVVPYEQMTEMYEALLSQGAEAQAICVDGAPHEGSFWSWELHGFILDFIKKHL